MKRLLLILIVLIPFLAASQGSVNWTADGNGYYEVESNALIKVSLPDFGTTVFVSAAELTPAGQAPLRIEHFMMSPDQTKVLVFTNTKKVWRLKTRGDYWMFDIGTRKLQQMGKGLPSSSLMFAEFSPDSRKVAYVSAYNVYAEDIATGKVTPVTTDGSRKYINGTFDWAYEEEFSCRDGIQWSPDSKGLAFWQIDARKIRDFYMINNTDSVYSQIVPVEYPTVGQPPSAARLGIANTADGNITWVKLPGDPGQNYIPRIEWNSGNSLFVQQLNRKQNESKIFNVNALTGDAKQVHAESDEAWVEVLAPFENPWSIDFRHKIRWINNRKEFLWLSEKDGWRHLYRITLDGKEKLITNGDYDVLDITHVDEAANQLYFAASPTNATQKYLYRTKLDGTGKLELVSPSSQSGTHEYEVSPNGRYAMHTFSNSYTQPLGEWISLPRHTA